MNSNISIISNYCIGGMIYRKLCLPELSPTINMYCTGDNFINFLKDIPGHLQAETIEYNPKMMNDNSFSKDYFWPKGILCDDSVWVLNHAVSFDEGKLEWDRRKKRFNYKNFVAIMIIQDDKSAYMFDQLSIPYKIGFYYKNLHLKNVIYLSEWQDGNTRLKYSGNFAGWANELGEPGKLNIYNVDWIRFLLHRDDFIRKVCR